MFKEYDNSESEEYEEKLKQKWVNNGMDPDEAEQLMYDSKNDPYSGDPDIDTHFDPSIDDRANEYGGFGLPVKDE